MNSNEVTISQLKSKWNKEKEFYKIKEVGSGTQIFVKAGTQIFVKDVLHCEDLFQLKKGLTSTPLEKRKMSFWKK